MDISISKTELSQILSVTENIVEKRTTMPILANVLVSATEGRLRLSATDLEITASASANAKVKKTGSLTVSAKILGEIVRELPDTDIRLRIVEGDRLEVSAKNSCLKIVGVSAEEFPSLPGMSLEPKGRVKAKQLSEMVSKTLYAVSLDETRFNLNGVCFEVVVDGKGKSEQKSLRLVATDGHRLAMITRPCGNLGWAERVIVPRKGLSEMRRVLDSEGTSVKEAEQEVGIDVIEGFLVLDAGDAKLAIRLIEGQFPDYNQVMPQKPGTILEVESDILAQALRRVALMVTDKGKGVKLEVSKNRLRISSSSPELGEAVEELDVKYTPAQDTKILTVGFNAKYMLDFIASLNEGAGLVLELNGELGPGKFSPHGDEAYIGIVMPMRL